MYQKYHPTPEWESSSASGLINGERLFEVVYDHAFGPWCTNPAGEYSALRGRQFCLISRDLNTKMYRYYRACHQHGRKVASAFQKECFRAHIYLLIASVSVFLLKQRETASVLNHKTRSRGCRGSKEWFKCSNSGSGTQSISGFGCGFGWSNSEVLHMAKEPVLWKPQRRPLKDNGTPPTPSCHM